MEIKKQWCTFSYGLGPVGIGKVVRDSGEVVGVIYSERQGSADSWDSRYIKKFNTLEEAIESYIQKRSKGDLRGDVISEEDIWRNAKEDFPSYFGRKK